MNLSSRNSKLCKSGGSFFCWRMCPHLSCVFFIATPEPAMTTLDLTHPDTHLVTLTGAGISAESGVATYRAMNGLWRSHSIQEVATPHGFLADPARGWKFCAERRAEGLRPQPNPGHFAITGFESSSQRR